MTIKDALLIAKESLNSIEARVLIKHILNKDNIYLISNSNKNLTTDEEMLLNESLKKIENGYPLQYITNNQEFMSLEFEVNENVLIPQPDTEVLVEKAIYEITANSNKKNLQDVKVLDLCTGSGAIAISLKHFIPEIKVYASDISEKALDIAKKNAFTNKVDITFIKSNMFENIIEKFDFIVSNPPYIKSDDIIQLPKDVQQEPHIALDGGEDGLEFYRIISQEAKKCLNNKGLILMEIGYNQAEDIKKIFDKVKIYKDYANNNRVAIWKNI